MILLLLLLLLIARINNRGEFGYILKSAAFEYAASTPTCIDISFVLILLLLDGVLVTCSSNRFDLDRSFFFC